MGYVIALSGPSGVGKTTFLQELFSEENSVSDKILILPRYTTRPKRNQEEEGFEYHFISHLNMLERIFDNQFVHFEKWGDYYSGIETISIESTINSDKIGIVLASSLGSSRLRKYYGDRIIQLYMWSGITESLYNSDSINPVSDQVIELKWRIRKKLVDNGFSEFETASLTNDEFLEKRMIDNYLDIAAVNASLNADENFKVLANLHNEITGTVLKFIDIVKKLN